MCLFKVREAILEKITATNPENDLTELVAKEDKDFFPDVINYWSPLWYLYFLILF